MGYNQWGFHMEYNKNNIYTTDYESKCIKINKTNHTLLHDGKSHLKDAILTSFCGKPCLWYAWSSKYHSKSENIKRKAKANV